MRRSVISKFVFSVLLAACLGGCSGGGGESSDVKTYDRASLPATKQELPALDEGRLEVPTPQDWHFGSREKSVLARFHLKGRSGIPQTLIKLDPDFQTDVQDVTPENVREYADRIQAQLDQAGTRYLEPCKPVILGKNCWARYVIPGKLPGRDLATIERQILKTTRGGRTYLIDLQVPAKELLKYRDAAYAIGAGIKFGAAGSGATEVPGDAPVEAPTDTPPEEKPALPEGN